MKKKRFTGEQIIRVLRIAEAMTIEAAARQHGVSEQCIYPWKRQFWQMDIVDARELRQLRQENARLKKVLAERDRKDRDNQGQLPWRTDLMLEESTLTFSKKPARRMKRLKLGSPYSIWRIAPPDKKAFTRTYILFIIRR